MKNKRNAIALSLGSLFAALQTSNAQIVLDFEGVSDQAGVGEFYNGGTDAFGAGPGPSFGISFGEAALGLVDSDAGGSGNIGGEPSPDTVLFFLQGSAVMDVPAGFDTGFSFFYSAINNPGQIDVYDGPNATGNVLTSLILPTTPNSGAPDPTGNFSPLVPFGVSFQGTALSVDFGGTANQIVFDNITLGAELPGEGGGGDFSEIPEPGSVLGLGLLIGFGSFGRRRK